MTMMMIRQKLPTHRPNKEEATAMGRKIEERNVFFSETLVILFDLVDIPLDGVAPGAADAAAALSLLLVLLLS